MELIHHKICHDDWKEILPFSTCWSRSCQLEPGSERRVTATWLRTSTAHRPFLKSIHELKKQLKAHMTVLMSELVKKRPQKYAELLSKVKCIVATTDAFDLEVEGRPDQGHDRTDGSKSSCPFRRSSGGRG